MKNQANEKIIALYCQSKNRDDGAIVRQKKDLEDYIYDNKIKNYKFYEDIGFSAGTLDRPAFKSMCADIKDGKISAVIVSSTDRIGRNPTETSNWLREMAERGVAVYSMDGWNNLKGLKYLYELYKRTEWDSDKVIRHWSTCKICHQEMSHGNSCKISVIHCGGKKYGRIKAGDKLDFIPNMPKGEFCHDCNAGAGQYHHFNCDAEQCPVCHGQLISCDCKIKFDEVKQDIK